jgi:hypothetical protein
MRLRSLAASGSVSHVGSVDVGYHSGAGFLLRIAAGDGRLAFWRAEARCAAGCRLVDIVDPELYLGAIGGPYESVPTCNTYSAGVIAGGFFAFFDQCDDKRVVTRNLTTGEEYRFEFPTGIGDWHHTGRYVALFDGDLRYGEISVHEATTGEELYRILDAPHYYAVDESGTLVLYDEESGEFSWASPEQTTPQVFASIPPNLGPLDSLGLRFAIRSGVVAVNAFPEVSSAPPYQPVESARYYLFDLAAGTTTSYEQFESAGEWGFDGRRLAWWVRPCELAIVQVWDPLDGSPALSDGPCPWAKLGNASSRVGHRGRIFVDARCPTQPRLGCTGIMRLIAEGGRRGAPRRRILAEPTYGVPPGAMERIELRLSRGDRRFVRRHGRVSVTVVSRAVARSGFARGRDGRPRGERRRFGFGLRWAS